jgi:hypothetical protein
MKELFKQIKSNSKKFFEHVENHCAQAAQDVLLDTIPIIKEMKEKNVTWNQLHKFLIAEEPGYIVNRDNFMIKVRAALNDENYWIETLEFYESRKTSKN